MSTIRSVQVPFRGAATTVAAIQLAALNAQNYYNVRQLAERICEHLPSKDYLSEYLAVFHFVNASTRYMRDPRTKELVREPWLVVADIQAGRRPSVDCDDYIAFLAALLLIIGARVRIVTAAFKDHYYRGERQYTHVWIEAWEPRTGVWVALDPVAGSRTRKMIKSAVALKIWPIA